ncbi:MAG: bifunctional folylpolyglutamate synthase/dihydrofolate synthase, partial [Kiritimatiellae bacterium]|nr:bifunctional folylpolyglutamate synthase/dihydrofolate synthase [Kiritimatiellia bacterium]
MSSDENEKLLANALGRCARFGVKPGLETIRAVCAAMGNPQDSLRVVHVAGTNGKGAVCALIDSALRAAGFRTGRYTSPHLVALNERFFLDGAPVSTEKLNAAYRQIAELSTTNYRLSTDLTYFELLTATAFELYAGERVDYLVLETGLGGRLDATNVVKKPAVCIITRIGLDHCDWLGHTIAEIAAEKGGIIKPEVPVVLGAMPDDARRVLERIA